MGRLLADQLDPKLVLARDLAFTQSDATAKPLKPKKRKKDLATHIFIPDPQFRPDSPTRHILWAGSFIADEFDDYDNVKLIVAGDWWDMPSLSSWEGKGSKFMENQRIADDILAGNDAFSRFDSLIPHKRSWEYHFLFGNHEDRITRAVNGSPHLEGLLSLDLLDTRGFNRHPYQRIVDIDGVWYSHVFVNPMTGRPYGGANVETRLKTIGHSFTMGHQQTLMYGLRFVGGKSQHGCVAGAFYLQDEHYKGEQGNSHWRGLVVKREVRDGSYSFQDISMDYLCRRYEGVPLAEYLSN